MKKQSAYHFFLEHAGYCWNPKIETQLQGRRRCAKSMATDEAAARDGGFYYRWSGDPDINSSEFSDETPAWGLWQCAMYNERGQIVASLHGIDFGRDNEPWGNPYKRVVEAELASEGLTNEPQGKGVA